MSSTGNDPLPPEGGAAEIFRAFLALGLTSFGGPVAQIAMIRRELEASNQKLLQKLTERMTAARAAGTRRRDPLGDLTYNRACFEVIPRRWSGGLKREAGDDGRDAISSPALPPQR